MKITLGKPLINKTWKYLLPCLKGHGKEFKQKFNKLFKLAAGIGDINLHNEDMLAERAIYVLVDNKYQPNYFDNFKDWIKLQDYYVTDYVCGDIRTSRYHMFVLKVPKLYEDSYDEFINSRYSKMYSNEEITILYSTYANDHVFKYWYEAKQVLQRKPEAFDRFKPKLQYNFGQDIDVSIEDFEKGEFDFPIEKEKEYFDI